MRAIGGCVSTTDHRRPPIRSRRFPQCCRAGTITACSAAGTNRKCMWLPVAMPLATCLRSSGFSSAGFNSPPSLHATEPPRKSATGHKTEENRGRKRTMRQSGPPNEEDLAPRRIATQSRSRRESPAPRSSPAHGRLAGDDSTESTPRPWVRAHPTDQIQTDTDTVAVCRPIRVVPADVAFTTFRRLACPHSTPSFCQRWHSRHSAEGSLTFGVFTIPAAPRCKLYKLPDDCTIRPAQPSTKWRPPAFLTAPAQ